MNIQSNRQLKTGELIKRTLVKILYSEIIFDKNLADISITVSEVRMSPDLKIAKIYVYPFGGFIEKDLFMQLLTNQVNNLRFLLTKKIKLKYSPELMFIYDDSFDNVKKINNLINSIQ